MSYSASIIDEAAPLKARPTKRCFPANVVQMPGGIIPAEIVTFPTPAKRKENAEPSREEVRAEDRRLAISAQGGCLQSFEQLVQRFEKPLYKFLNEKTKNHHLTQKSTQRL